MKAKRAPVVIKLLSLLLCSLGIMMLLPFSWALLENETALNTKIVFGSLSLIGIAYGCSTFFMRKVWRTAKMFRMRDGFITVMLAWLVMVIYSAMPYLLTGCVPSFTDAFYESMSGYTTTGSSIIPDVSVVPQSILLWRAMTQWIGGIGIIVFLIAALPAMGLAGNALFAAEVTGPVEDKVTPRIKDAAKNLCYVYLSLSVAEWILLIIAGMPVFDAICYTMSTVATGGFSTQVDSAASYSAAIQYIITVFMFLSGINYMMYYLLIKKQFRRVAINEELRVYAVYMLLVCVGTAIALFFTSDVGLDAEESFRHASFQCVSIATTTGFVSAEFTTWAPGIRLVLLLLMFVGACAGSSTGAIKTSRFVLMIKNTMLEFKRAAHPRAVLPLKYSGVVLGQETVRRVFAFFFLYILVFLFGSIIFAFCGYDFETSFSLSASSLGNVGPAMGQICGMCAVDTLPALAKWVSAILMLIGRLGIFTVLIMAVPSFWKNS